MEQMLRGLAVVEFHNLMLPSLAWASTSPHWDQLQKARAGHFGANVISLVDQTARGRNRADVTQYKFAMPRMLRNGACLQTLAMEVLVAAGMLRTGFNLHSKSSWEAAPKDGCVDSCWLRSRAVRLP